MFKILKQKISWNLILFLLAASIFIIYSATSGGATPYNYFTRLAIALLHGKYYLDTNPTWLNELIPIATGKFVEVYPPAPAIVSIPFILIFGAGFQQQILSQIMGALAAFVWGVMAYQKSGKKLISLWIFLLTSLGNIVWFMSSNGSVWYTGQISAFLFLTLTIYESLNKKRLPLLILYFGLAFLSRLQVVLALPLIVYLNLDILRDFKKLLSFALGLAFFGIVYGIYNYLRFGSFIETGYGLIPGVLSEPWFQKGIFNISYIPNHLKVLFTSLPIFLKKFPFVEPSWGGLSIWITSPVFIYSLFANFKKREVQFSWLSILLIALVVMSHGSTGFVQFGYRFAVDFYPLILFLLVEAVSKAKLKWHHWLLLSVSILVNFWGVIFINKFGFAAW
jgi:hypothetical protein